MLDFQIPAEDSLALNRDRILAALIERRVSQVVVTYEGGGDSGDVNGLSVEPPEAMAVILADSVALRCVVGEYEDGKYLRYMADRAMTLRTALADFTLEWVCDTHGGWENNDGGSGTVTIDVAAGTLKLEHTEYYTESTDYVHEL